MTYTSGTAFAYTGTAVNDFEAWKVLSGEKDSYNEQTAFLSETVLEPAQTGNLKNAKPLAFVTTDLNGTVRDEQTPTIGAYEYGDVSDNTPVLVEGYPSFSNITHEEATAVLKVDLSGKCIPVSEGKNSGCTDAGRSFGFRTGTAAEKGKRVFCCSEQFGKSDGIHTLCGSAESERGQLRSNCQ